MVAVSLQHINVDGRILGLQRKTQVVTFNYELRGVCYAAEPRTFCINLHNERYRLYRVLAEESVRD